MPQSTQRPRPGPQNLEWYRSMRDTNPVWRGPKTGIWHVFRYQDVAAITCTPGRSLHEVFLRSLLKKEEVSYPHQEAWFASTSTWRPSSASWEL
jgi:hypothetical protein